MAPMALLAGLLLVVYGTATAQESAPAPERPAAQSPTFHPTFPLLDLQGENVLTSGKPVSTIQTCGACHDTEFIEQHSFHADVGLSEMTAPGQSGSERAWDTSAGLFGRWNPLIGRYLSPEGDDRPDLTTAEWIQLLGARHVGGGPAVTSRDGDLLTELPDGASDLDTHIIDPKTGELIPWDWAESGVVEMNCFLCHTPEPNNDARLQALHNGQFQWANTATLLGSGIVEQQGDAWSWNQDAFDDNGELAPEFVTVQGPRSENCAQCHGLAHVDSQTPLALDSCSPEQWSTITTGQIVSPQRISDSGMNISSKEDLGRFGPWRTRAAAGIDIRHDRCAGGQKSDDPVGSRPIPESTLDC
jgi:hypothetical protein